MGLEGARTFLRRHKNIAFDTSVFIYQLEANPRFLPATAMLFEWLEHRHSNAVTSTITMTELLVGPYRASDQRRVVEYYGLLSTYPNLRWIAPGLEVADIAARLRSRHNLRTPDALQAATAIYEQATGFVTNDTLFRRIDHFETLVLDQLL